MDKIKLFRINEVHSVHYYNNVQTVVVQFNDTRIIYIRDVILNCDNCDKFDKNFAECDKECIGMIQSAIDKHNSLILDDARSALSYLSDTELCELFGSEIVRRTHGS